MKKMTLQEWETKYIESAIERFDPRNQMFTRPMWDPEIKGLLDDWSIAGSPSQKSGFTLEDQALRWGSNAGTALSQQAISGSRTSNPPSETIATTENRLSATTNPMASIMSYQVPEGTKADTSDQEKLTNMVKKTARWFGADLVGICNLDRRWIYESTDPSPMAREIPDEYQNAIVLGFEMDYGLIRYFNTYTANAATRIGYSRMAVTNAHLASFIRYLGFQAIESGNDTALSIPLAMQAGLGDIGRNGILITPEFGPRIRLSKVFTDLPLLTDQPIDFGVTEFCEACKKCAQTCPSRSISTGNRTTEPNNKSNNPGALKWPINAETCRTYWSRVQTPCVSCIATCPYNKEYSLFHRGIRWITDNARWSDSLFVKMDDLFGYGRQKKVDNFWNEWQPSNGYGNKNRIKGR
ncbi:MAG: reductive dehalogenase [Dehalococcoidales bacterium]|nr:MAG: reductive dehalogenase [Dehalococcoidales bacterium]